MAFATLITVEEVIKNIDLRNLNNKSTQ